MYKMSMIKKNGKRDYFGIFPNKELAEKTARDFMELDGTYISFKIWYTE